MHISDTLKKAASLFVEMPASQADLPAGKSLSDEEFKKMMGSPAPTKTVEQIVKDSPGPNLDEIKVPDSPQVQPMRADGTVDYRAIYDMAHVQDAPFTAEQLLELLATLPQELPIEARRQTVKITIEAMAKTVPVTPEIIVADASRKLAALAAYDDSFSKQAQEFVAKSEADIVALQSQIESKKKAIDDAKAKHEAMDKACTTEAQRLDDVLEFFSLDIPPSKFAVK